MYQLQQVLSQALVRFPGSVHWPYYRKLPLDRGWFFVLVCIFLAALPAELEVTVLAQVQIAFRPRAEPRTEIALEPGAGVRAEVQPRAAPRTEVALALAFEPRVQARAEVPRAEPQTEVALEPGVQVLAEVPRAAPRIRAAAGVKEPQTQVGTAMGAWVLQQRVSLVAQASVQVEALLQVWALAQAARAPPWPRT